MNVRQNYTTEAADAIEVFDEHARVTLAAAVDTDEGRVPAGASGSVVSVYDRGAAYCIEFTHPFATLAIVHRTDLVAWLSDDGLPGSTDALPGGA